MFYHAESKNKNLIIKIKNSIFKNVTSLKKKPSKMAFLDVKDFPNYTFDMSVSDIDIN